MESAELAGVCVSMMTTVRPVGPTRCIVWKELWVLAQKLVSASGTGSRKLRIGTERASGTRTEAGSVVSTHATKALTTEAMKAFVSPNPVCPLAVNENLVGSWLTDRIYNCGSG